MKKIIIYMGILLLSIGCKKETTQPVVQKQNVDLKIDGYTNGGNRNFIETTVTGEEVAITLGPVNGTFEMKTVQCLFGGTGNNAVSRTVKLKIYKDIGAADPGTLLFSKNYTLISSLTTMHSLDIRSENIVVNGGGSIRVSFELLDGTGFPSFAQEYDGTYFDTKNWIKESNGTWKSNDTFGVDGNWVIRASVDEHI